MPVTMSTIRERLSRETDAAPLVWFRVLFGALAAFQIGKMAVLGHIPYFGPEIHHFTFFGFDWVRPLPGIGMHVVFVLAGAAALGVALGVAYRASALIFAVLWTYIFLIDKALYLNHFYLVVLLAWVMVFLPAADEFSIDAWWRGRSRGTVPLWSVRLAQFTLALPYVFGGIAKINSDWLAGLPLSIWLFPHQNAPLIGPLLALPATPMLMAYGGMLLDLLIVPVLCIRRTRIFGLVTMAAFHLLNAGLFVVGMFPWFMLPATWLLLRPDGLSVPAPWRTRSSREPVASRPILGRVAFAAITAFVAVQVLLPFRHVLYPGDQRWTGEGYYFAWHMLARQRSAEARFRIVDRTTGESGVLLPKDVLHFEQMPEAYTDPDMILQFAHRLAEEARLAGRTEVAVYADIIVSMNRRPPQYFVDPDADLAALPRTLGHHDWIVPLVEEGDPEHEQWLIPVEE